MSIDLNNVKYSQIKQPKIDFCYAMKEEYT